MQGIEGAATAARKVTRLLNSLSTSWLWKKATFSDQVPWTGLGLRVFLAKDSPR